MADWKYREIIGDGRGVRRCIIAERRFRMTETGSSVKLPFFERYLSLWVIFCIIAGVIIGKIFPAGVNFLSRLEVSRVNIPVAVLIWLMIYPMMVQIDFSSIVRAGKKPK